ncbi:FecR family protein [Flavivirga eckloniae]|uniref:FecR family protein n=1 Tax=Flavivirga eckloniae TaxID=1803846 RepID=A0A2K9PK74_9FLAO|nr:FecR family protein [Flavivirga eckloniae]AUP77454.1 hypothetical protein C1H87_01445 [Flavivirga eckloniae]
MEKNKINSITKFLDFEFSSVEEKEALKASDAYSEFKDIIELFDGVKGVNYDEDKVLRKLDSARLKPSIEHKKVIPLYKKWLPIAAAASLLLFVSVYFLGMRNNLEYNTLAGESVQIALPDASKVWLNAKSELAYNKDWKTSRAIDLKGEGYFEVAKGKTFTVKTPYGTVTVLGTKFNVKQRQDFFEVYCYEGTVSVMHKGKETILKANSFFNSKVLEKNSQQGHAINEKPYWIEGISVFENAPIDQVVSDISIQYDIEFIMNSNLNINLEYTGKYNYNDTLEDVLNVLCQSLNLKYTKKGKRIYLNEM